MRAWFRTLRGRLALAFGGVAVVSVLLTGFGIWWQLERDLGAELEQTLRAVAASAVAAIDPARLERLTDLSDPYYEELRARLHQLTIDFNLSWLGVYRYNGTYYSHIADGEDRGNGFCLDYPLFDDSDELLAAWKGTAGVAPAYEDAFGTWQSAFYPVRKADGTVVGVIDASRDLNVLRQWRRQVVRRTAALGAIITCATLILCFLFAVRISRPVADLSRASREIAGGRLDIRLHGLSSITELQALLDAFDAMTGALETSQVELKRHLAELTSLNEVARQVNFAASTEEVLRVIIAKTMELLRVPGGRIYLHQDSGGGREPGAPQDPARPLAPETGLLGSAVAVGEAPGGETVSDAAGEGAIGRAFVEMTPQHGPLDAGAVAGSSHLCLPLLIAQQALGVMVLAPRSAPFEPAELALGGTLAAQAAMTIEKSRLYELSVHDGLTHLFVHRYFQLALDNELRRARRYGGVCGLILLDVDHFKKFNDTWGHQTGDLVLKAVSAVIKETVRTVDIPARYGGEEFAVILPETPLAAAKLVAERLRQRVADLEIPGHGQPLKVTISLGVATFPDQARDKTDLVRRTDLALYAAKGAGRNRVMVAEAAEPPVV